jgi:hypothetical protein
MRVIPLFLCYVLLWAGDLRAQTPTPAQPGPTPGSARPAPTPAQWQARMKHNYGEIVENLASSGEYHWMCGNFLKYAGPLGWNDLPVDAHELIAIKGMYMACVAASPVYALLGRKGLSATSGMPPAGTPLIGGDLAFGQHLGGHTPNPNWPVFLLFASRYITLK